MTTINPYLAFKGNCEEAFDLYKSVFGGEFRFIGRYKDLANTDRENFASMHDDKIMHMTLVAGEIILMGCDTANTAGKSDVFDNMISLSVNTDSKAEADRFFNGLSKHGKIAMPMNETFWGSYFGDLTDRFGIRWQISFDLQL